MLCVRACKRTSVPPAHGGRPHAQPTHALTTHLQSKAPGSSSEQYASPVAALSVVGVYLWLAMVQLSLLPLLLLLELLGLMPHLLLLLLVLLEVVGCGLQEVPMPAVADAVRPRCSQAALLRRAD